jgi:ceramide glucosyltransferase
MGGLNAIIAGMGWVVLALSVAGTAYMAVATTTLLSFPASAVRHARRDDPITVLKPLCGDEPRLEDNLASFLVQDHAGSIQMLCGVQRADDPAIRVVEQLRRRFPDARIDLVVNTTAHGANRKVANLINLEPHIAHGVVALSDSDIVVKPDYLSRLAATLDTPGTGVVTVAYNGRGDAGFWSRLAAAGLSWQFLPGVAFGAVHHLARPCMGSTIALRRETLREIGGFAVFADTLADDYALGEAVSELGLTVALPPMLVTHASAERTLRQLWRHEVRWGATVRNVLPAAYVASVIAMPLPLALLALPVHPPIALACAALALLARLGTAVAADRWGGGRTAPLWLLPVRDCLTFAVFIASFAARSVDWRGATLKMARDGRIAAEPEFPPP